VRPQPTSEDDQVDCCCSDKLDFEPLGDVDGMLQFLSFLDDPSPTVWVPFFKNKCISLNLQAYTLNFMTKWLALLLCIWEVAGSNFSPTLTTLIEVSYGWFSLVPPGKCQDSALKLGHNCFLPHPF
jgi:hypothetical protein